MVFEGLDRLALLRNNFDARPRGSQLVHSVGIPAVPGGETPLIEPAALVERKAMAEIFGTAGDPVTTSGAYECSECGHRIHLADGETFPPDHHPEKPWTLYLKDE